MVLGIDSNIKLINKNIINCKLKLPAMKIVFWQWKRRKVIFNRKISVENPGIKHDYSHHVVHFKSIQGIHK